MQLGTQDSLALEKVEGPLRLMAYSLLASLILACVELIYASKRDALRFGVRVRAKFLRLFIPHTVRDPVPSPAASQNQIKVDIKLSLPVARHNTRTGALVTGDDARKGEERHVLIIT